MKRFVSRMALLFALLGLIVVVMHMVAIARLGRDVDAAYTLGENQKYLFLGSSQLGCAVEERDDLCNKVLWVSDTSVPAWHLRLLELERRGQLAHVKAVIVPYNFHVPNQQNDRTLKWAFYQELPISYRYLARMPFSAVDMAAYIACNLRFPFAMQAISEYPRNRPAIASRPQAWRDKNLAHFVSAARATKMGGGCVPQWESLTRSAYAQMQAICKRHGIRFVIYRQPVLAQCYDALPGDVKAYEDAELLRFRNTGAEILDTPHALDDSLFFDSVHFMEPGTRMFTDLLFKRLAAMPVVSR